MTYPCYFAAKCFSWTPSVGTMLVDKYHSHPTSPKSNTNSRSNNICYHLFAKCKLVETRVSMRVSMIRTGGRTWVKGGLLVKPLWLIFYSRAGDGFILSSLVVSYLSFIENNKWKWLFFVLWRCTIWLMAQINNNAIIFYSNRCSTVPSVIEVLVLILFCILFYSYHALV